MFVGCLWRHNILDVWIRVQLRHEPRKQPNYRQDYLYNFPPSNSDKTIVFVSGWGDFFLNEEDPDKMGSVYTTFVFQLSFATTATTIGKQT